MTDSFNVTTEQVDDIPVLLAQGKQLGVPELLDRHFVPHGNWQGTSLGWTALVWLAHILSEGDHRLNQVEQWVAKRLHTLGISTGQPVRGLEWSDDRLGIVLDELADDEHWQACETDLNRHTFRVYALHPQRVRVDSTTVSGHWTVTEEGLFQFGHSKGGQKPPDHRPDLPQLKVMLSALDPLGLPVATQVVSGERADDKLYIPAIQQVRASLDEPGLLYVGDCKMAALATRAFLQHGQNYYLCPLAATQLPEETLKAYLQPVWEGKQALQGVTRENTEGQLEPIAEGYEQIVTLSAEVNEETLTWTERRLIVRSLQQAHAMERALRARLGKAQSALQKLNAPKQGKARLESAADKVLQHYRVMAFLKLKITEQHTERQIRAYGDRPARTAIQTTVTLQGDMDEHAVQEAVRGFGWRVYVTNQPQEMLPLQQAVLAYREEYRVERGFGRLKGKPLSVFPMYLQSDARATGLIRLLSLGLRMLTLLEHRVRQRLADWHEKLPGLYAGNPKRATARPTAEAMLRAFKGLYLSMVTLGEQVWYHVTPLSQVQSNVLSWLDFSENIYTQLVSNFPKPGGKMAEP